MQVSFGQCGIFTSNEIVDLNTTSLTLLVNNAVNNTLGENGQGVCLVRVNFKHQVVGDINMYLIAPNGQIVQLIGSAGEVASPTFNITWDVSFIPSNSPADPDAGIGNFWNNNELWVNGINRVYDGMYYPYDGSLEDFDGGTVNGSWTLVVEDVIENDAGIIDSFSIVFCDDTGVNCNECLPDYLTPSTDTIEICRGTQIDSSLLKVTYSSATPDTINYRNDFLIFGNNQFKGRLTNTNESSLSAGNYKLCAINYHEVDSLNLPTLITLKDTSEYQTNINQNGVCAKIGECIELIVLPVSDTIVRNFEICKGDSLTIYGNVFKEEGKFFTASIAGKCDTIVELNIDVIDLDITLTKNFPVISCINKQLNITANVAELGKVLNYNWSTISGNIVSANGNRITVNAAGTYIVEVTYMACTMKDTIVVETDINIPNITLNASILTCENPVTTINLSSSLPITSATWTGVGIVSQNGFNIDANAVGTYTVTTLDANGCESVASIVLNENKTKPTLTYSHDSIRCEKNTFRFIVIDSSNLRSASARVNNTFIGNILDVDLTMTGNYTIFIEGYNGCVDSSSITIEDLRYSINVSVATDTFTCEKKFIIPVVTTDRPVNIYDWNGPVVVNDVVNPTLTRDGIYTLTVRDRNGCTGFTSVEFILDTIAPPLVMSGRILGCNPDSILLIADDYNPNLVYNWGGPGLSSNEDSVYVKIPNLYTVTATDKNQCTKRVLFNVAAAMELPDVVFNTENIECLKPTANITPDKTNGFTFQWLSTGMINDASEPTGEVGVSGTYLVRVTNAAGCFRNYALSVGDIRQRPTIEIPTDTIGCNDDSIQINLTIDIPFESIKWTFNSSIVSSVEDPFIMDGGMYIAEIVDSFGCVFLDTVTIVKDLSISGITTTTTSITCDTTKKKISAFLNETGATYEWSLNNQILSNTDSLLVNVGGQYRVVVQNLRGCVDTAFVDVLYDTISPIINIFPIDDLDCTKDEVNISLTVDRPIKDFSWSGIGISTIDSTNAKVNQAGSFIYSVKDERDCIAAKIFSVADSSKFTIVSIEKKDITCDSIGSIKLTFSDFINGLSWEAPINIQMNTRFVTTNSPGIYKFILTNSFGCKTVDSILIKSDKKFPIISNVITDVLTCEKDSVLIGFELDTISEKVIWDFNQNINSTSLYVDNPNFYTGIVIGYNGCITPFGISVTENVSKPQITILGDTIDCQRSKIDLVLNSPDSLRSVTWTGPNNQNLNGKKVKISQSGTYIATVVGSNGCLSIDSITITDKKVFPFVDIQDTFLLPCNGDSVQLFITTMDTITTFRWVSESFYSNEPSPFSNDTGQMIILLGTLNGCVYTDTTNLIFDPKRPEFSVAIDTIICDPSFATITPIDVLDDFNYYWKDTLNNVYNEDTLKVYNAGLYYLIVEGNNRCKDSTVFLVISDTISPTIDIGISELFGCDHLVVDLIGTVGNTTDYSYQWNTQDGDFVRDTNSLQPAINSGGTYNLKVKNERNNCTSIESIIVSDEIRTLDSYSFSVANPACLGDANGVINLTNLIGGIPPYIITLNGDEVSQPLNVENLLAGDYFINVSDSFGCLLDTIIILDEGFDYSVILPQDTLINIGLDINIPYTVADSINIVNATWEIEGLEFCNNCESINLSPISTTLVNISVVNDLGCKAEDEILIIVNNKIAFDLPNVFHPNSTIGNDRFFVPENPGIKEIVKLDIYDNWGNIVFTKRNFQSGQKDLGWDGKFNGKEVNPGVFVIYLDIVLLDDSRLQFYRDLTVIR